MSTGFFSLLICFLCFPAGILLKVRSFEVVEFSGTIIEVNVSELGLVTQTGKVIFAKYAQVTNNPDPWLFFANVDFD